MPYDIPLPSLSSYLARHRSDRLTLDAADGPSLSINTSGFDEAEATHIKYFVRQLGVCRMTVQSRPAANCPLIDQAAP
mgnify:FL=1